MLTLGQFCVWYGIWRVRKQTLINFYCDYISRCRVTWQRAESKVMVAVDPTKIPYLSLFPSAGKPLVAARKKDTEPVEIMVDRAGPLLELASTETTMESEVSGRVDVFIVRLKYMAITANLRFDAHTAPTPGQVDLRARSPRIRLVSKASGARLRVVWSTWPSTWDLRRGNEDHGLAHTAVQCESSGLEPFLGFRLRPPNITYLSLHPSPTSWTSDPYTIVMQSEEGIYRSSVVYPWSPWSFPRPQKMLVYGEEAPWTLMQVPTLIYKGHLTLDHYFQTLASPHTDQFFSRYSTPIHFNLITWNLPKPPAHHIEDNHEFFNLRITLELRVLQHGISGGETLQQSLLLLRKPIRTRP